MRIFIFSKNFFPQVAGMETIIDTMAREFVAMGHEVRLATTTPLGSEGAEYDTRFPYPVVRDPGMRELFGLVWWCDVYYQNDAFLKKAWPLVVLRRPLVIEYMMWRFGKPGAPLTFRNRVVAWVLGKTAWHMGQSHALVRYLPFKSEYVPTPFRSELLRVMPGVVRDKDVVFAGRVIREKGVGTLLEALGILNGRGKRYTATIVGRGNDLEEFKAMSTKLGLDGQVEFAGVKMGEEFATLLNRHEVMAVPSIWDEPFGTVAAEGIACGCVVVASDSGGLPDTVGPCGVLFGRGDAAALAGRLEEVLENRGGLGKYREKATDHLAQFRQDVSAEARLGIFRRVMGGEKRVLATTRLSSSKSDRKSDEHR
ncbi:MAG TPA: glycosyltransferase family 4 protein [Tepidisphaeraceae bacterium]|jgi:glycosyltransferase involved in cell wall biosynthesis|nr:glycosyltransferase family 4 protein [Tepidisphaeraceae bacterium]